MIDTKVKDSKEYRAQLRHSAAHILAEAMLEVQPDAKLTIGPSIENGFYYDFDLKNTLSESDLPKLEKIMRRSIKANTPFVEKIVTRKEAQEHVKDNRYKKEILDSIEEGETLTLVSHSNGNFVDLCRGGHVSKTGEIKAFKLLKIAGAFWRGDNSETMLQRIYGTAWESKDKQKEHLDLLARAERFDHRKIGREQKLFFFNKYAPAHPFFLPKGTIIVNEIMSYLRGLYTDTYGYAEVSTPQLYNSDMWKISGHYDNYAENMYFVKFDEMEHALKPMNCPAAALIFKSDVRSYRDLPIRLADFGGLHRYEMSGAVHGLTRVRSFRQDDAHVFCTKDQIFDEVTACLNMVNEVYDTFGFKSHEYTLSLRPEKRVGSDAVWDRAEKALLEVLKSSGKPFEEVLGEGAFYGPKIDIFVSDALNRKWQLGTVQLDFSLPERFGLQYVADEGHQKVVVVHRTIIGSLERFLGVYIEHLEGKFPIWLAPTQVMLVPIADRHYDYAKKVALSLKEAKIRVEVDTSNERMNAKIRKAQSFQIPIMCVVGDREVDEKVVSIRQRDGKNLGALGIEELTNKLCDAIKTRQTLL